MSAAKASAKRVPESSDNLKPKRQKRVIAEDNFDSAISSVATEKKSKLALEVKLEIDRQNFAKGRSNSSKECVKFFEKFLKERSGLLQAALKGIITKYEEQKEMLLVRYEQLRKKERLETANSAKRAQVHESLKNKKQDDKTFRFSLGSFPENASEEWL